VIATVRNPDARAGVEALGATAIAPEGFGEHGPFDVILELVGAPNLDPNLDALAVDGRIATIGIQGGAKGELNLSKLLAKRARIHGSTLRARPLEERALTARRVEREVLPHVAAGAIHVPIAKQFSLDEAAEAYAYFMAGNKLGKVILLPHVTIGGDGGYPHPDSTASSIAETQHGA